MEFGRYIGGFFGHQIEYSRLILDIVAPMDKQDEILEAEWKISGGKRGGKRTPIFLPHKLIRHSDNDTDGWEMSILTTN